MTGWITEWAEPAPESVTVVDDALKASDAVRRMRAGEVLRWTGDFHNGRQFLGAIKRRLSRTRDPLPSEPAARWRAQRALRAEQATVAGRLVILLQPDGAVQLRRAPDTRQAVLRAWGASEQPRLVGLSTLLGALSAESWREKGLVVPNLEGRLVPHYGVFSPTRSVYVQILDELGGVRGKTVLDVGCGTGVLALVLLQLGARSAVGTDIDERSVRCATENAATFGLPLRVEQADLWNDDHVADVVIFNAPWMPEPPRTRLDRSVYDEGGRTLQRWLTELAAHLTPRGRGVLLVSDLPERLGLRAPEALPELIEQAGLVVQKVQRRRAAHPKAKQGDDPLYDARSEEQICMWVLRPRPVS